MQDLGKGSWNYLFLQKIAWFPALFGLLIMLCCIFIIPNRLKIAKCFKKPVDCCFFGSQNSYTDPCLFSAFLRYAGIFSMARLTGFDKANCQAQPISSFSWADFALFSGSPTYGLHNIAYGLHNIVYRLHNIAYVLHSIAIGL